MPSRPLRQNRFLDKLWEAGRLFTAGAIGEATASGSGAGEERPLPEVLYIFAAASLAEAEAVAGGDPFVAAGGRCEVRRWTRVW